MHLYIAVNVSYLADSGTSHGVNTANASGADVTIANICQLLRKYAIQGKMHAANVKNIAIDILATNVLHCGPTYSRTIIIVYIVQENDLKNRN